MKTLIIIVSYNFEQWIDRCLGSLRKSTYPVDVMVIDNGSKDRTINIVKKDYPEVRLIETGENLGFGRANNIGMKFALDEGYDFAFLLNQDAWIDNHTIEELVAIAQTHPEYGILSPVHLDGKGDNLDFGFQTYSKQSNRELCMSDKRDYIDIPFVNAAFWMLPRKTMKMVGGFSPLFYHYGEDIDYVNRVKYHGLKIAYSPKVAGFHDRAKRPAPTGEAFYYSEYVYHLSEYANINYSFIKAFAYGPLACIKKIPQGKGYIFIWWKLIQKTVSVIKTRKVNQHKQNNHL
ncbi:MAG: glycosyltransferase family 2 protein [Bacteroidaceae bacterium]|nr:glycosyltransferase family 2 protein [Bacteroidaceae bacterium]